MKIADQFEKIDLKTHEIDQTLVDLNAKIEIAGSLLELTLCDRL